MTLPHHGGHSSYSTVGMIAFESGLLALGTFLVLSKKLDSHEHHGVMLGVAAGILFGVSDVAIKAITTSLGTGGGIAVLAPWLVTAAAASVIAFYASARGLQKGEAVPVITLTSAAANVTAISGGILVFGDPMPGDPLGIALQSFAFVLVIVAARSCRLRYARHASPPNCREQPSSFDALLEGANRTTRRSRHGQDRGNRVHLAGRRDRGPGRSRGLQAQWLELRDRAR